ncbi:Hypothetical predicted protein [Prunus dulcis]|uniref:Uncharacterized protein n=1 Tax=Prunus dulcis TaxID=3755 RepID=A0A5E4EFK5_PRUDU|nr:Hypothetical predicted protein [Prunus dulcis]
MDKRSSNTQRNVFFGSASSTGTQKTNYSSHQEKRSSHTLPNVFRGSSSSLAIRNTDIFSTSRQGMSTGNPSFLANRNTDNSSASRQGMRSGSTGRNSRGSSSYPTTQDNSLSPRVVLFFMLFGLVCLIFWLARKS